MQGDDGVRATVLTGGERFASGDRTESSCYCCCRIDSSGFPPKYFVPVYIPGSLYEPHFCRCVGIASTLCHTLLLQVSLLQAAVESPSLEADLWADGMLRWQAFVMHDWLNKKAISEQLRGKRATDSMKEELELRRTLPQFYDML